MYWSSPGLKGTARSYARPSQNRLWLKLLVCQAWTEWAHLKTFFLFVSLSLCLPLFISLSLTFLAPPEKRERERSMGCWWMMGGDRWPCRVSAALLPEETPGPQGHSRVTLPLSWRMPLPPLRERAMSNVYLKKKKKKSAGKEPHMLERSSFSCPKQWYPM